MQFLIGSTFKVGWEVLHRKKKRKLCLSLKQKNWSKEIKRVWSLPYLPVTLESDHASAAMLGRYLLPPCNANDIQAYELSALLSGAKPPAFVFDTTLPSYQVFQSHLSSFLNENKQDWEVFEDEESQLLVISRPKTLNELYPLTELETIYQQLKPFGLEPLQFKDLKPIWEMRICQVACDLEVSKTQPVNEVLMALGFIEECFLGDILQGIPLEFTFQLVNK